MIYRRLLRPLLFTLNPETAHHFVLAALRFVPRVDRILKCAEPIAVFGLRFRHRLGLAAGFDKNGIALSAWETLGFAFAEIGTVTAQPQAGNPPPRIFRYPEYEALINRLGFNNDGAQAIAERMARLRTRGKWPRIPVGINIGKSRDTPVERAADDYLFSLRLLRPYASYVTVNVSSPNTPGLRDLQEPTRLNDLLQCLNSERVGTPLLIKIAPDLEFSALDEIVAVCEANDVSGIIATNTTLDHSGIRNSQSGGLSGVPLREKSTGIVRYVADRTKIPIVGCGGIFNTDSAREKIDAGATLLQIYTGLVYRGPRLIRELAKL
jgi:dihydroorotate dehydrogenase